LLLGEVVAVVGAGESALRADAEVLERHELGRLLDPPFQLILGLELRDLGAHQAEHHLLPLGDVAQRLEAAGALGVELEEKPTSRELRKPGPGHNSLAPPSAP